MWIAEPASPALVLGSAQRDTDVDQRVASALGIDVVRRRSGGGAVLVLPGEVVWIDVIVGREDPMWDDDVGRSMHWLGAAWQSALGSLGVAGSVHEGRMLRTEWSAQVCFAGTGAGEVVDDGGAKLVGIAQRRTRSWARFQSMVHLRWRPELVAALVAPPRPTAPHLAAVTAVVSAERADVESAFLAALPNRP